MNQVLIVVFVVGIVVGIAVITIGLGLGRSKARGEPTPRQPGNPGSGRSFTFSRKFSVGGSVGGASAETGAEETAAIAETIERLAGAMGAEGRVDVTTTVGRTALRLDGPTPSVEVDGVTYHSLADVPADARVLLLDELRLVRDSGLPDPVRSQLDAFLATADMTPESDGRR